MALRAALEAAQKAQAALEAAPPAPPRAALEAALEATRKAQTALEAAPQAAPQAALQAARQAQAALQTALQAARAPDFTQAVTVVLQTFAVLVGVSITDLFDTSKSHFLGAQQNWLFFALIALLLRFIIGSAIHLNHVYGNTDPPDPERPREHRVLVFFKDLAFLVFFGWIAVRITHSETFCGFLGGSLAFVGAAFVWSVLDAILQRCCPSIGPQRPLWRAWTVLDGLQFVTICLFICNYAACPSCVDQVAAYFWPGHIPALNIVSASADQLAPWVAFFFILFLFLDIVAMIRGPRIT
ncbi:MAG: hypothetical protein ACHQRJ_08215 [Alphaproteobacteria bacterium]